MRNKYLWMLSFCFLYVSPQMTFGQGTVGNGGGRISLAHFVFKGQPESLKTDSLFTLIPYDSVDSKAESASYLYAKRERCEQFFSAAKKAWRVLMNSELYSIQGLVFKDLNTSSKESTSEKISTFFDAFLAEDLDELCGSNVYRESGIFAVDSQRPYLAINIPDEVAIIFDYRSLNVESKIACTLLFAHNNHEDECKEKFFETIALHEVLSLVFPRLEGSFNYSLSLRYFSLELMELAKNSNAFLK